MDEGTNGFLTQVKGFTPVIDVLADEVGLVTAVVYGIVWRYCKAENGVCQASKETIAAHAHISDKTVQRHLQKLCEYGYLEDKTPKLRNRPHTYVDTGKAAIIGLAEAKVTKTKPAQLEKGGTESPTKKGGRTESPAPQDTESHPGRTESPMKREREEKESGSSFSSSEEARILWAKVMGRLHRQGRDSPLIGTRAIERVNGDLRVKCTAGQKEWIDLRVGALVEDALGEFAPGVKIIYEVSP